MKRLLWIDTDDCLYQMDPEGNYQKEMRLASKGGKREFFFEMPDGPLIAEGVVIGLHFGEIVLDLIVKEGMIRYHPQNDNCWIGVDIEFFEGGEIEELYQCFKQSWVAKG